MAIIPVVCEIFPTLTIDLVQRVLRHTARLFRASVRASFLSFFTFTAYSRTFVGPALHIPM